MPLTAERKLPGDWYDGIVPMNVVLDPDAYLESSYGLCRFRSRAPGGLRMDAGAAAYTGTMFDVGPRGQISIGRCSMVNVAWLVCDERIEIGDHVLISWNAVIMDTYRTSTDPMVRRRLMQRFWREQVEPDDAAQSRAVRIGDAAWIGFDSVVLPGVTIGDGAVIGCRSVVAADVPPYTVAAGNPARILRSLPRGDGRRAHG